MEKTWRISLEEYQAKKEEFLSHKLSTGEWAKESLKPHTYDEIMFYAMLNTEMRDSLMCMSYVYSKSHLCEDLIKDLIYIYSGFAIYGEWDDRIIDWVYNMRLNVSLFADAKYAGSSFNVSGYVMDIIKNKRTDVLPEYYIEYLEKMYWDGVKKNKESVDYSVRHIKTRMATINRGIDQLYSIINNGPTTPVLEMTDTELGMYIASEIASITSIIDSASKVIKARATSLDSAAKGYYDVTFTMKDGIDYEALNADDYSEGFLDRFEISSSDEDEDEDDEEFYEDSCDEEDSYDER